MAWSPSHAAESKKPFGEMLLELRYLQVAKSIPVTVLKFQDSYFITIFGLTNIVGLYVIN